MRVIVCGSRSWKHQDIVRDVLYDLCVSNPDEQVTVVNGGAAGADRIAKQVALQAGMLVETHVAAWDTLGKRAGLVRNQHMADLGADLCVAFWDGRSTGTMHMVECCKAKGIPVRMVMPT